MKAHLKIIDRILDRIGQSQSICIVGHVRPDGDCVGSQLGLAFALQKEGKDVYCWNENQTPNKYAFLDPDKVLSRPGRTQDFDLVIAVDCASYDRLGGVGEAVSRRKFLINIDHHQSNTRYGDLNWISAREASTGELIFRLLRAARWPITPAIADCLFTAVSTDTGSFQYSTTKPVTYHTAGELVKLGANLEKICH
jgi:bifunctional oligoribonuclease and PAP phosphatase NrnA